MIVKLIAFLDGLPAWQATLLVLIASLVGAVAMEMVGLRVVRRLVSRTESQFDDIVFEEIRFPIVVTVFLVGIYLLSQTPSVATSMLGSAQLDRFFGKPSLTVLVLVWAWALNQLVNRSVIELQESGHRYEFAPVFSNVWTLAVLVTSTFLILSLWEIDITPLIGAAGIAGIAIGFAAKDTVANFFGGIALYFDDTYKLGDFVVLESGEAGTVVKVGVRSTTLLTRSEVLVTVPNSMLNAGKVVNQSAPQRRKRIRVPIGVSYETDIDAFEALALEVAADEDLVMENPEPRIRFRRFGDSALEYELLCWVPSPKREGKAKHNLNRALFEALGNAGIEIPYPKRDLTVTNGGSSFQNGERGTSVDGEHAVGTDSEQR